MAHVVSPANGLHGDVHDFKITDEGTALMTIYDLVETDLTPSGKSGNGWIYEGIFQEVDIETGELIFQWSAGDYYNLDDSYFDIGEKGYAPHQAGAYDYYHINSIEKRADGTYLASSRYMHSVTCISATGEVLWVLGGKRNMFKDLSDDGSATGFTWQHDARWHSDRIITLLDNGANEHEKTADHTRGLMIELDFDNWTARTLHVYHSPGHFSSHSQGNLQVLPQTGNVFIGWGKPSAYTEFSTDGTEVLCDAHYGPSMFFWFGWIKSYRAQKANWVGKPSWPPSFAVYAEKSSHAVYVSWNGATEIAGWLLQRTTNRASAEFETLGYEPKKGFETRLELAPDAPVDGYFYRVAAVDFKGEELGYTRVFAVSHHLPDLEKYKTDDLDLRCHNTIPHYRRTRRRRLPSTPHSRMCSRSASCSCMEIQETSAGDVRTLSTVHMGCNGSISVSIVSIVSEITLVLALVSSWSYDTRFSSSCHYLVRVCIVH